MADARVRSSKDRETEIGAADPRLLAEPLDFLEIEHYRQRALLHLIERILPEPKRNLRAASARIASDFIESDLALHLEDEEIDLFPLLHRRCPLADGLERIVSLVVAEPGRNAIELRAIAGGLASVAGSRRIPATFPSLSARFVKSQRRLLEWEDTFILPLARRRLTDTDMGWLSERMIERRKGRACR
jgi:hemerythrin-like domain-containing protein